MSASESPAFGATSGDGFALVALVEPHDETRYLAYIRDVYGPGLATMPGFRSLRVLRWQPAADPVRSLASESVRYVRISTWDSAEARDAYVAHPLRQTFHTLLDLAVVDAYGAAEVVLELEPPAPGGEV